MAVLVLSVLAVACERDRAAIEVLKEHTSRLADIIDEQNDKLASIADDIESCRNDLMDVQEGEAVPKTGDVEFDMPTPLGEESVESLEKLEASLTETLGEQRSVISELKSARDQCKRDLYMAKQSEEEAEEKAAAAAAEK